MLIVVGGDRLVCVRCHTSTVAEKTAPLASELSCLTSTTIGLGNVERVVVMMKMRNRHGSVEGRGYYKVGRMSQMTGHINASPNPGARIPFPNSVVADEGKRSTESWGRLQPEIRHAR